MVIESLTGWVNGTTANVQSSAPLSKHSIFPMNFELANYDD